MLIGIDGSEAFVKSKTGVENYAYQIIKHLSLLDSKNKYIIYLDPRVNNIEDNWPENFKFKVLKWPLMWTQLGLGIQSYSDNLDLLFIPSHTLPLIKNPALKSVVTVHDLGARYLPMMHQIKQRLYLSLMTKLQLTNATRLIAVSKATKKDIVKSIGINPKYIEVIYEGFNSDLKKINTDIERSILLKLKLEKKKYFLFVGTVQPRKNLINLIMAYSLYVKNKLEVSELVIAGGQGWLSDKIYKLPEELRIKEKVKFLGRVDNQTLAVLYNNALALTYPSFFEGFGLPILEAFNFKLPVITSNISSMPEVAGKGAILVNPYKIEEITLALEQIEKDHKLRQKLINEGLKQLKSFSWKKAAEETLSLFESVVKEKVTILGTKINNITMEETLEMIDFWIKRDSKRYIVTPNIEFLIAAKEDKEFQEILNKADLAIPDSARFNWAIDLKNQPNLLLKIIKWPLFLYPKTTLLNHFPITTGTDLMEELLVKSNKESLRVGLLGGTKLAAERLGDRINEEFPNIKLRYFNYDVSVDKSGQTKNPLDLPPLDILFVAFGQVKQEKWINNNLTKQPVKVMIGVGGAFDYLSGIVPRAPKMVRNLGFEWLFRLILQPWRIRRFWALIKFIFILPFSKNN